MDRGCFEKSVRSLVLVGLLVATASAQVIYVDGGAMGVANGTSWADAYNDLQAALNTAQPGDQVWIAAGTYHPAPSTSTPAAGFAIPDGVALYGGFAGGETTLEQRDFQVNVTILDGDIAGDDVRTVGAFENGTIWMDNVGTVVTIANTGPGTRLDGFAIYGGKGQHLAPTRGGGIGVHGATVTIANCEIAWNGDVSLAQFSPPVNFTTGPVGAEGLFVEAGSSVVVEDCRFHDNWASDGGAVRIVDGTHAVRRCDFTHNRGTAKAGAIIVEAGSLAVDACHFSLNRGYTAGAISGALPSSMILSDSAFQGNRADFAAGFLTAFGSGAVDALGALDCRRCEFDGNLCPSTEGGALTAEGNSLASVTVDRCRFLNNSARNCGAVKSTRDITVLNSEFQGNHATKKYGAMGVLGTGVLTIRGCTVQGNIADIKFGGVWAATLDAANGIFWGNVDPIGIGRTQLWGSNKTIVSCCVQDLFVGPPGENPPNPNGFPNSIDSDPMFVDAANGDLHLLPGSPCIDAGDQAAAPGDGVRDRDGNTRFFDDVATVDTGLGLAPLPDMGAFEFGAGHGLVESSHVVSLTAGATVNLEIDMGPVMSGANFWMLGSTSGTSPGLPTWAGIFPINPTGSYWHSTLGFGTNTLTLTGHRGTTDALGRATVVFSLPPGTSFGALPLVYSHAAFVWIPTANGLQVHITNPASFILVP